MTLSSDGSRVEGLGHGDGSALRAVAVVLATGTFLGGRMFRGEERMEGGRIGEAGAHRLAQQLRGADLPIARLTTGPPPRIDGRTNNRSEERRVGKEVARTGRSRWQPTH